MEGGSRVYLNILKVPHAEVWTVKNKEGHSTARGNLEVLYNNALNSFIFRIGKFKFSVDKLTQVVATVSPKSKYHAYLLARPDGCLIVKIAESEPNVALNNFETILQNNTQLVRKSGLDHRLDELTKGGILTKVGDALTKGVDDTHPNQRVVRTYDELIGVESSGVSAVDISADEARNLKDEADEIIRNHQDIDGWREYTRWGGIEGDTLTTGPTLHNAPDATTALGKKIDEVHITQKNLDLPNKSDPGVHVGANVNLNANI